MSLSVSKYIYGTTRLGDDSFPFGDRQAIARKARDAGVWMHTSHQYGDALKVLRSVFDEDRSRVPQVICKIGWDSVEQVREQIDIHREALDIPALGIGQLCLGENLGKELQTGGPGIDGLKQLKAEGLVGGFVLEVWPWNSENPIASLRAGVADELVDGYIFYFNPLQRFATNELWDMLIEGDKPIIAMRTVGGGSVSAIAANPQAPEYLRKRAQQVLPLFKRSGCGTWPEFAARYVFGIPQVQATVGATSKSQNLAEFVKAVDGRQLLPLNIQEELAQMQRQWSDEHDRHAEQWSM